MSHISSHKLEKSQIDSLNKNFSRLLASTVAGTREQALSELLTHTERLMIAKRLGMLLLISQGETTYYISKLLRVSPSTVARFEVKVESGEFARTLIFLQKKNQAKWIYDMLAELARVPFELKQRPRRIRKQNERSNKKMSYTQ